MNQRIRKSPWLKRAAVGGTALLGLAAIPQVVGASNDDATGDEEVVELEMDESEQGQDDDATGDEDVVELEIDVSEQGHSDRGEDDDSIDWDAVDAAIAAGDDDALADLGLASVGDIPEVATPDEDDATGDEDVVELEIDESEQGHSDRGEDDDSIDWDAVDAAIAAGDDDALADLGLAPVGDIPEVTGG